QGVQGPRPRHRAPGRRGRLQGPPAGGLMAGPSFPGPGPILGPGSPGAGGSSSGALATDRSKQTFAFQLGLSGRVIGFTALNVGTGAHKRGQTWIEAYITGASASDKDVIYRLYAGYLYDTWVPAGFGSLPVGSHMVL